MARFNFTSFPQLQTERLLLQPLRMEDANEIFLLRTDEETKRYVKRPATTSMEQARQFIQRILEGNANNQLLYWALRLKNQPALMGTICFFNFDEEEQRGEIGYELLPAYRGKGYMQEAVRQVITFGFDTLQLRTIEAWVTANNDRSITLLEKIGLEEDLASASRIPPEEDNMIIYSIRRRQ